MSTLGATLNDECHTAIQKFFEDLSTDEIALFEATTKSQQLIDDLQDVDNKHKSHISRKIAPKLKTFVAGVEQFGGVMDLIASSVSLMSPIWGSVRIVLKVAGNYGEYFDKISDMFEEIGYILSCLRRYPRLYPDNQILRDAMVEIFHLIFQFCSKARDVFHQGEKNQRGIRSLNPVGLHAAWKLIWKPFQLEFGDIIDQIRSSMVQIDHEVDVAEKELASKERTKAEQERQLQTSRWDASEAHQKSVIQFIDQQRIDAVNQWLAPVNAVSNHTSATKLRHKGTGNWFLEGATFQKWVSTENAFLWLHAIPGAGKTVLASTVIEWLREAKQSNHVALTYFYCDYKDSQKQSPTRIISTLLSMLASRNNAVFDRIQNFFEQQYKENPAYTPEFDELLNNFNHFVADSFEEIYIVLDALDESEDRECLAHALKTISETCPSSKIFVTSRHEIDIARTYEDLPITTIEVEDVAGDIDSYVNAELTARIKARKLKLRDPELAGVICETLIKGAHGMFQWVKCQIDQLCKLRNDKAVRNALSDLPKTLHDTYIRILQKLETEHAEDVEIVQRLLKWLVRGVRNLTLSELAECVSIDLTNPEDSFDFDAVFTDAEDVIELCGSLVTLSSDGYVALAHYTVKEFLVSDFIKNSMPQFWIGCGDVHAELASICLTYLTYEDFLNAEEESGELLLRSFNEYKFLPYAAQSWGTHARLSEAFDNTSEEASAQLSGDAAADASNKLFDLAMRLLESYGDFDGSYHTWLPIFFYLRRKAGQRYKSSGDSPLYFASLFGLPRAVAALINGDPSAHKEAPMKASAGAGHEAVINVFLDLWESIDTKILERCLYIAAGQGHEGIVQALLQKGANVNTRSGRNGTPLQIATLDGRHRVVLLLLDHGADLNVTCQRYGVPLAAAAEKGHYQTFKVLLDHGANVNGRGGWYAYPLVSAIVGKNMHIVDTLIEKGANLNALGGRHGCALMAASSMGLLDLIRSLVVRGARVNDENDKGTDSLYAACMAGNLDSVKLLLELGADVNAKGGKHRNALNAASAGGHLKIVQCLLDAGADVEFFDEHYGNSVQMAASAGHADIVRLLAEAGVDVNAPSADRGTALVSAAQNGHAETVALLFELGVPAGDTYETSNAITMAASRGHTRVVEILVEMGTVTDDCSTMSTYPNCTPLEAAAFKGKSDIIRLLLDLGADVNATNDQQYGTPLIAACCGGELSLAVAELLLENGADINATVGSDGGSCCALVSALRCQNYDLCVALIDRGADVNTAFGSYYTPLMTAVLTDNERLVELLFDHDVDVNLAVEPSDEEGDDGCLTALQTAAYHGHVEMIEKLVQRGAQFSVDIEGATFITALQAASFQGHVNVIQFLIEAGCDVNQVGGSHGTSLQAAAFRGHFEAAQILIEAGADINISPVGDHGSSLMAAVEENANSEIARLLVEHGADVNLPVGGPYEYPLTAAAWNGATDAIQILIEAGANVNNKGGKYATALQAAASEGVEKTCSLLLEYGADPNIVGGIHGTALQAAYSSGYYNIIWELFDAGASVSLGAGEHGTPLGSAIAGACQTLVSAILRHHDADPNAPVRKHGTPLQKCICIREDDVLHILLDVGADVNARGGVYGNALVCATVFQEKETILALLDAGANINLEGNQHYPTAAYAAVDKKNLAILRLLVEKGADLNISSSASGSILERAALKGNFSVFRYLLNQGADIKPSGRGKYHNALQAASIGGNKAIVKTLLRWGFDINTTGGKFGTALTAAILSGNLEIAELLLKKGIDPNAPGHFYSGALQAAAATGSIDGVLLLLRHGADIHKTGGKYFTVLQAASISGIYDLIQLLLEQGAEVNVLGGHYHSALHAAAFVDWPSACELLMKNGAQWSLMSQVSHLGQWRQDNARKILQKCRDRQDRGWPEDDSESEWSSEDDSEYSAEDDSETDDDEDDDKVLKLNVEAIPLFDLPYRPPGACSAVGENELLDKSDTMKKEAKFPLQRTNTDSWSALEWVQVECGSDGDLG